MGHSNNSHANGVTQQYVGAPTRNFYNDRADQQFQHPFGPEFGETGAYDVIKKRVSEQELQEWQQLNEPTEEDRTSRNARDRAKNGVRQQRHQNFIATAPPTQKKMKRKDIQGPALREQTPSDANVTANLGSSHTAISNISTTPQQNATLAALDMAIDPQPLNLDGPPTMAVDDTEFEFLCS